MTTTAEAPAPWDRYWAYGNLHSFSQVHDGNYQGCVAAFWQERFQDLSAGARIVDVATGNGAVAMLALDASDRAGGDFAIAGTDLADIDPVNRFDDQALREKARRIRFHARTPAEALPFDDGAVDLVCSQFGIEYSDLARSIPEVGRVLTAGGQAAFIMHHHQSAIVRSAFEESAQAGYVLDEVKLYLKARNLLRAMAADGSARRRSRPNPKIARKRQAVDQAIARIEDAAQRTANANLLRGPLNYVREVLAMAERRPAAEALEWLEEARQRVLATRARLEDMKRAGRSDADMQTLQELLRDNGFADIEHAPLLQEDRQLIGWRVTARRT